MGYNMEVVGIILLMLFIIGFFVIYTISIFYQKWCIRVLNDKFKLVNQDRFTEIIKLYKDLSFIDKIKFKYIINYTSALEIVKENEIKWFG